MRTCRKHFIAEVAWRLGGEAVGHRDRGRPAAFTDLGVDSQLL